MSDVAPDPSVQVCAGDPEAGPVREIIDATTVRPGEHTDVRRLLPRLGRRMVGAWCFVDTYGPDDIADEPGMQVAPHPHTGLQTVSWLLDGEVHHRDSLGSDQVVRAGELGLMTAGSGIAHSEQSPDPHSPVLRGAQLWVALPEAERAVAPRFEHHTALPVVTDRGLSATVLLGEFAGAVSPGRTHSPLAGVDVSVTRGADVLLPLQRDWEYAVLTVSGHPDVADGELDPGVLLYLGCGRDEVRVRAGSDDDRLLLLGGAPFDEKIVMFWNFIGRSSREVASFRAQWQAEIEGADPGPGRPRFGAVPGYRGDPLPSPALPAAGRLRPRGRVERARPEPRR